VSAALPAVPAVACFDTSFHATLPESAATYALPEEWRRRWGLQRFGFHGLSHRYASARAAELTGGRLVDLRVVSCHLGAGASLCAVAGGRSVDTTMGFTPLDGLVMNTRAGSVDPGLVLWLITDAGLAAANVTRALESESGLAGLTGTSGDLRDVLVAAAAGNERARLGLGVYAHRLRREIAGMVAALGGLDVLAFTGGVGEHLPTIRAAAAQGLRFLGVAVDPDRNAATTGDGEITAEGAPVRTVVVTSREDIEIARQVRKVLGSPT
jgi:acetate kinase